MPIPTPPLTVPAATLSLLCTTLPSHEQAAELQAALQHCGRRLGHRVEIDLDLVADHAGLPQVAQWLLTYWQRSRSLWAQATALPAGSGVMLSRRLLVEAEQVGDGRKGRVMLTEELKALEQLPGLGSVVHALLGPTMPEAELSSLLDGVGGHSEQTGQSTRTTRLTTDAVMDFDPALGGPGLAGEVRRHFVVESNHAAWRDRRLRRLVRLSVEVDEVWPDPVFMAPVAWS